MELKKEVRSLASLGIDIGGKTTGKSVLARSDRILHEGKNKAIFVTLYESHAFNLKETKLLNMKDDIKKEEELLRAILDSGYKLYVDLPLDTQNIPYKYGSRRTLKFPWETKLRPIDKAVNCRFAPFADKLGYSISRFSYLLFERLGENKLGKNVFETYPRASLLNFYENNFFNSAVSIEIPSYKGSDIKYNGDNWIGSDPKSNSLSKIATDLNIFPVPSQQKDFKLNDDELDAIICALAGVVDETDKLENDNLNIAINTKLRLQTNAPIQNNLPKNYINFGNYILNTQAPKGYVLLRLANKKYKIWLRRIPNPKHEEVLNSIIKTSFHQINIFLNEKAYF